MECLVGPTEDEAEDRQTQCAERHQSVFDFSAGKITGGETAHADTERERDHEQAGALFGEMHPVTEIEHTLKDELADKRKVDVTETGQPEHAVLSHQSNLGNQIAEKVPL